MIRRALCIAAVLFLSFSVLSCSGLFESSNDSGFYRSFEGDADMAGFPIIFSTESALVRVQWEDEGHHSVSVVSEETDPLGEWAKIVFSLDGVQEGVVYDLTADAGIVIPEISTSRTADFQVPDTGDLTIDVYTRDRIAGQFYFEDSVTLEYITGTFDIDLRWAIFDEIP
jgi:hypothetical protein